MSALPKLLSCSIIKAGPWLTLPLIYVPMLLLRLKAWGFSSAVSGGLAVAYQNNFYHDAQLDHLETKAESHRVLNPAILTAPR